MFKKIKLIGYTIGFSAMALFAFLGFAGKAKADEIADAVAAATSGMASGTSFMTGTIAGFSTKYLVIAGVLIGFGVMVALIWYAYHKAKGTVASKKKL